MPPAPKGNGGASVVAGQDPLPAAQQALDKYRVGTESHAAFRPDRAGATRRRSPFLGSLSCDGRLSR